MSAELNLAQPQEVQTYIAAFKQFAGVASYGSQARAIITAVMDELRAELPTDGDDPDAPGGETSPSE